MAYATPEEIAKAKEMDLLTYLRNYEPGELVKVANGTYCTREHDYCSGLPYPCERLLPPCGCRDHFRPVFGETSSVL